MNVKINLKKTFLNELKKSNIKLCDFCQQKKLNRNLKRMNSFTLTKGDSLSGVQRMNGKWLNEGGNSILKVERYFRVNLKSDPFRLYTYPEVCFVLQGLICSFVELIVFVKSRIAIESHIGFKKSPISYKVI
jgi:hypothetical protein